MKYAYFFLLALLTVHAVTATSVVDRLKVKVKLTEEHHPFSESSFGSSIGATHLSSSGISPHSSFSSPISSGFSSGLSGSASFSGSGSGSDCSAQPSCGAGSGSSSFDSSSQSSGPSVDDAVKPIAEWIKDFKHRTDSGADLYVAAKSTVKPLIDKLRRNQKSAQERLHDSNEAILKHVEDAATQHVYALLKVDRAKMDDQEHKESLANKILDAKAQEKIMKEEHAAMLGVGSESAAAIESAIKAAGLKPSKTVVDHIAQILESSAASASSKSSKKKKK